MTTRREQVLRRDPDAFRQARRSGKEKGVHVYVAADILRELGIDPDGPAPSYRVRKGTSGYAVFVNFRDFRRLPR